MMNCIDLFSGAGGFAEGFKREGFNIRLANDIWEPATKTYKENHPSTPMIHEDIYNLNKEIILRESGLNDGEVDVIIGGPPCQGFSTAGKRAQGDHRNTLFKEYARIVDELKPKYFVMENVKGILSMDNGDVLADIIETFDSIGYSVEYRVLNSADYGIPQHRKRTVFIGARSGYTIEYPDITHSQDDQGLLDYITLNEALLDLPEVTAGETSTTYKSNPSTPYQEAMRAEKTELSLHTVSKHNDNLVKMMSYIPEGGSAWTTKEIPQALMPNKAFKNSYARLNGDEAGMTITRNFSCVSSSRCIHPKQDRSLTMREAARIQSFPDCYNFLGTKTDISLQIGNAVPPLLSQAIAIKIRELITDGGDR